MKSGNVSRNPSKINIVTPSVVKKVSISSVGYRRDFQLTLFFNFEILYIFLVICHVDIPPCFYRVYNWPYSSSGAAPQGEIVVGAAARRPTKIESGRRGDGCFVQKCSEILFPKSTRFIRKLPPDELDFLLFYDAIKRT